MEDREVRGLIEEEVAKKYDFARKEIERLYTPLRDNVERLQKVQAELEKRVRTLEQGGEIVKGTPAQTCQGGGEGK